MGLSKDYVRQAGALAVREGRLCLVTSRRGKHWVIPKGCLEAGRTLEQIVLLEAWEEAGLVGLLLPESVGSYEYRKAGRLHVVKLYLLDVIHAESHWPERHRRERVWLRPAKAVERLREDGLRRVIESVLVESACLV